MARDFCGDATHRVNQYVGLFLNIQNMSDGALTPHRLFSARVVEKSGYRKQVCLRTIILCKTRNGVGHEATDQIERVGAAVELYER